MLSGYADYMVWYKSPKIYNLATNLTFVKAKKTYYTDTCFGQLAAYMGVVHAYRKDYQGSSIIYGVASDGNSFRFCRIDDEGNWSQSRLMELDPNDKGRIYSVFRSLIRIAASSSPSTSKEDVPAPFDSPERTRNFRYALSALQLVEEDDEMEIVSWQGSSS